MNMAGINPVEETKGPSKLERAAQVLGLAVSAGSLGSDIAGALKPATGGTGMLSSALSAPKLDATQSMMPKPIGMGGNAILKKHGITY